MFSFNSSAQKADFIKDNPGKAKKYGITKGAMKRKLKGKSEKKKKAKK